MSWKSLKFRQYWSYSGAKLNASDSDIVEALKSIHQSIVTKIKNYACEDWIVLDVIFFLIHTKTHLKQTY